VNWTEWLRLPHASCLQKGKIEPARLVEIPIIPAVWQNAQEHDFSLDNLVFHKRKVWTRERILELYG
jgi:hypothetical protein